MKKIAQFVKVPVDHPPLAGQMVEMREEPFPANENVGGLDD
jgi:hypothetical protein